MGLEAVRMQEGDAAGQDAAVFGLSGGLKAQAVVPVDPDTEQPHLPLTNAQLRASEVPFADGLTRNLLGRILNMLLSPLGYDGALKRYRQTSIIESGTVTTVTTVTTCASVTNLASIGGDQGQLLTRGANQTAWALNMRARIT